MTQKTGGPAFPDPGRAQSAKQREAVVWYCDAHGYTDNKDDAESWRDRGMPVTEYCLHPAPSVPEGWQLVPKTITLEMQHAYFKVIDKNMDRVTKDLTFGRYRSNEEAYRAMLSAAPKAPTTDDRKDAERYRWLRDTASHDEVDRLMVEGSDTLDAAIDAAMDAKKGEKE